MMKKNIHGLYIKNAPYKCKGPVRINGFSRVILSYMNNMGIQQNRVLNKVLGERMVVRGTKSNESKKDHLS